MKKNIVKSLYSFGTAVLAFGTLATASMPIVSATTHKKQQFHKLLLLQKQRAHYKIHK